MGSNRYNKGCTELWGILAPSYLCAVFIAFLLKPVLNYINHVLGAIHRGKMNTNFKMQVMNTNPNSSELLGLFCQI